MKKINLILVIAASAVFSSCSTGSPSLTVYFGHIASKAKTLGNSNTTAPMPGQAILLDNTDIKAAVAITGTDLTSLAWTSIAGSGNDPSHLTINAWLELWDQNNSFLNFGTQTQNSDGNGFTTYPALYDFATSGAQSLGSISIMKGDTFPYGYLEITGVSTSSGNSVGNIPAGFFYPGSPSTGQVILFFADSLADSQALYIHEHTTNQFIVPGGGISICIAVPGMTTLVGSGSPINASFDINTANILDENGNLVYGWWNNISFTHD